MIGHLYELGFFSIFLVSMLLYSIPRLRKMLQAYDLARKSEFDRELEAKDILSVEYSKSEISHSNAMRRYNALSQHLTDFENVHRNIEAAKVADSLRVARELELQRMRRFCDDKRRAVIEEQAAAFQVLFAKHLEIAPTSFKDTIEAISKTLGAHP